MTDAIAQSIAVLTLRMPGEPIPKGRPRLARNGHTYTPDRTREAELQIAWALKERYPDLAPVQNVEFRLICLFYTKSRAKDLDNMTKLVMDSLTGLVWEDDRQVVEIQARVFRGAGWPRIELTIETL